MKRVLVVNHNVSEVCGIHDIGKRIAECLRKSDVLEVGYAQLWNEKSLYEAICSHEPDAVIINYRADLTPWAAFAVGPPTFAVLHQYEEATADARAAELLAVGFDHVLALDPGLSPADPRVHAVGRPIPETTTHYERCTGDQVGVGSFGFAFPHKGFVDVAREIADQWSDAAYLLHMPEAYFNGASGQPLYGPGIAEAAAEHCAVYWTHDHVDERELVARLSMNDVNCLFYVPGQPDAGLSSAIDYLIAARRPMLLSGCAMFRHAWNAPIWPDTRLGDILNNYVHFQQEADVLYESMAGRFVRDIEKIVGEL